TVNVQAKDGGNNNTTNYSGTVHFTSSDPQPVLPANSTLTSGFKSFTATLKTAGTQSVIATDTITSSITGSASVAVIPAALNHFKIAVPVMAAVNTPFNVQVTAQDQFSNTETGYTGTVHFASSGAAAP